MAKELPEKCCAKCRYLLAYPKNNSYGDADYLCVKIGRLIFGRNKDIEKVEFYKSDGKTPDRKAKEKCKFENKVTV